MAKIGGADPRCLFDFHGDKPVLALDQQIDLAPVRGAQMVQLNRQLGIAALLVDFGYHRTCQFRAVNPPALSQNTPADPRIDKVQLVLLAQAFFRIAIPSR